MSDFMCIFFFFKYLQAHLIHKSVIWFTDTYINVMTLNQRSVNVDSTLYACWALSIHHVISLGDGTDSKYEGCSNINATRQISRF